MNPMHDFHVRIAAQFAEYRCTFDGFVANAVELTEQRNATNIAHTASLIVRSHSNRKFIGTGRLESRRRSPRYRDRPSTWSNPSARRRPIACAALHRLSAGVAFANSTRRLCTGAAIRRDELSAWTPVEIP